MVFKRFFGEFVEMVYGEERVREVNLLYHLEDDTISLIGIYSSSIKGLGQFYII